MEFIELKKHMISLVKWINSSVYKSDARSPLQKVYYEDGQLFATNGLSVHAAKLSDDVKLPRTMKIASINKFGLIIEEHETVNDSVIKNIKEVLPSSDKGDKIVFEIDVSPHLLIEALKGINHVATLRFYGELRPLEVTGTDCNDINCYSLIMPMHKDNRDNIWTPFQNKS